MKKNKSSKIISICLAAILAYLGYLAVGQQKIINLKAAEYDKLQEKIADETKINDDLKKEKDSISSDEYIEKTAREKLNMVKKGERVFVDAGQ
ncbi:MAG: septum formation initiator family protein [Clostridiales bacterium]|nr:septum formation initiator family protein [Clostridiales bacterium]